MSLEWFWSAVAPPAACGLLGSLLAEQLLVPRPPPLAQRAPASFAAHCGLWLALYGLLLAVVGRPWLATGIALALVMAVVVVNNAKFRSLREPFVVHDFEYFIDAMRHPRLYLPFLRVNAQVFLSCAAVLAGLALAIHHEPWLFTARPLAEDALGMLSLLVLAGLLLVPGRATSLPVSCDVAGDLSRMGLLVSLWRYACEMRRPLAVQSAFATPPQAPAANTLAHLVVVQSESFFDPRALWPAIDPALLQHFDASCREALSHGPLTVPAWGANTIRTEFAFLSGLSPAAQGVHQFQPYRQLARQPLPQLVRWLKHAGYRTVAVHPYAGSFYQRARVFAALGFDEFITEAAFRDAPRAGPYVSDLAVADKIRELVAADDPRPLFVFAITMENHGPLHLETVAAADEADLYASPPPAGCDEFTVYLRHLRNADRMLAALRETLLEAARPGCLCWYGDHVPIMPKAYRQLGEPAGETVYCLWRSDQPQPPRAPQPLAIHGLAALLCRAAGFRDGPAAGGEVAG